MPFEFYVRVMPRWRLWFWWRDWDTIFPPRWKRNWLGIYRIRPTEAVKQRYWKLQIGPFQFVFWHKKR